MYTKQIFDLDMDNLNDCIPAAACIFKMETDMDKKNKEFEEILKVFERVINSVIRTINHTSFITYDDLKGESEIALYEALLNYKPEKCKDTVSYFYTSIKQSLIKYVIKNDTISNEGSQIKPACKQTTLKKYNKMNKILDKDFNDKNINKEDIEKLEKAGFSDSEIIGYFKSLNLYDNLKREELNRCNDNNDVEDDVIYEDERTYKIVDILKNLNYIDWLDDLDRDIIRMKLGDEMSYADIAKKLGISRQLVHLRFKKFRKAYKTIE